jgi:multidrug efflux system membrane fusion protein
MNDAGQAVVDVRKRNRWRVVFVAVVAVASALLLWRAFTGGGEKARAAGEGGKDKKAQGPVPVAVAAAEKKDLPVYLTGLGTVTAFNTVTVKSRVDGPIVSIPFREGQDVRPGDLLVQIDPQPFEVALRQAQANLAKDEAQLSDARLNLTRFEELTKEGVIPEQQLDSQRATVHQFEGATGVDRAQVDNARLQLGYTRITAPLAGRVGLRQVDIGNIAHASDQNGLLVITQLDPITAIFTLPEDNLPAVARRMSEGKLVAEAWSRDDRTKLAEGTLLTVDNQIDPQTGTGKLKAVFPNPDHMLWPNQFVNVRLRLEVRKDQTLVPAAAVQRGAQGSFAYVMKPDHTVEMRPVKVALAQGDVVAVADGVAPGESVVTDGQEKLQAGSRVEPHEPGAPAGAAGAPGPAASGRGGKKPRS